MTHLILRKKRPEADNSARGLLILLLIMGAVFSLKAVLADFGTEENLCDENFIVAIEGDIEDPGVYAFNRDVSLEDLIERGGGVRHNDYTPWASCDIPLNSGIMVDIKWDENELTFSHDEMSAFYKVTLGIPVSLNRETEHGLTAIPGIGPRLAERIIRGRTERGGFKTLDEIKSINGVGDKLYNKILPYIELF